MLKINYFISLLSIALQLAHVDVHANEDLKLESSLKSTHINRADINDKTPLFYAVEANDIEMAKLLITAGANVNHADRNGTTPLFYAVEANDIEMAKLLITAGADVNHADRNDRIPLIDAIENNSLAMVQVLMTETFDLQYIDEEGHTLIMIAAAMGTFEILEFLIEKGANVHGVDEDGNTALIFAARMGEALRGEMLVAKGINVHQVNTKGENALLWAERVNCTPLIALLKQHGAQMSSPVISDEGWFLKDQLILEGEEAFRAYCKDKMLIGLMTYNGLGYDSIVQVGSIMMDKNDNLIFAYVTEDLVDILGKERFSGFILPGAFDQYPKEKDLFTWDDIVEPLPIDLLYQRIYRLSIQEDIPVLGICAGAQHIVMSHKGSLMKNNKNNSNQVSLKPYTPLYYLSLNKPKRKRILETCDAEEIAISVFREHQYAAHKDYLGEGLVLAAIDGDTPLAYFKGFEAIGTQFHPEAYYEGVIEDDMDEAVEGPIDYVKYISQEAQTNILDGFIEMCNDRRQSILSAEYAGQSREEGVAAWKAHYKSIENRLQECQMQQRRFSPFKSSYGTEFYLQEFCDGQNSTAMAIPFGR